VIGTGRQGFSLLSASPCCSFRPPLHAWAQEGHEIIALIAEPRLHADVRDIERLLAIMERMRTEPVTNEELKETNTGGRADEGRDPDRERRMNEQRWLTDTQSRSRPTLQVVRAHTTCDGCRIFGL